MGKNLLVSEETIRDLLEAHASLSAWYHELTSALRRAHGVPRTPDDATRAAFVERLGVDFPELAQIAATIQVPRVYVPPPPPASLVDAAQPPVDDGSTLVEPALARVRDQARASRPEGSDDRTSAVPDPSSRKA